MCKNPGDSAFLYKDTHVALLEILWGLGRQYLTRKKIYLLKDQSPYFTYIKKLFLSLSYEVLDLPIESLKDPDLYANHLDHTTLAVVMARDIPFLAKTWDTQNLCGYLYEKKIVQVEVIHESQYSQGVLPSLNPSHVQVYDFLGLSSLVVTGRRVQYESPISSGQNWDDFNAELLSGRVCSQSLHFELVKEFESNLPDGAWKMPLKDTERIYDRAIFAWRNLSATAVLSELCKQNSKYHTIQTSCLISWGGLSAMCWLESFVPDPLCIRGLIVVPANLLEQKSFLTDLLSARDLILKLQES